MPSLLLTSMQLICESKVKHTGANAGIAFHMRQSDLGFVLVANSDKGLCYVGFADTTEAAMLDIQKRFPHSTLTSSEDPVLQKLASAIAEGKPIDLSINLHVRGTQFQSKVWQALLEIPRGKCSSYSEIARQIKQSKAVRAVGTAIGANPIAVLIPCHRVLRSDGQLGGYRWGLDRKRALLQREGAI